MTDAQMDAQMAQHETVLRTEAVEALRILPDGVYVDATFGRGGHSSAILENLSSEGRLLALDRDPDAVSSRRGKFELDSRFSLVQAAFDELETHVTAAGYRGQVQGILWDLGVSSPQLDEAERGFSFMRAGPLDMRMDPAHGDPLSVYLQRVGAEQLADILFAYGQERYARKIAAAIVRARDSQGLHDTLELAEVVRAAHPAWVKGQHPATRTFQALRIWVNDEHGQLQRALAQLPVILAPGARVVCIAFHSLEDNWLKTWAKEATRDPRYPANLPVPSHLLRPLFRNIIRLQRPTAAEIARNPRSRSARMRVWERCVW